MTPAEIEAVRIAVPRLLGKWLEPPSDGEIAHELHTMLLALGAFVQPADGGYLVYSQTRHGSIAWHPDSLIIAMARGIVELAREHAPHTGQGPEGATDGK